MKTAVEWLEEMLNNPEIPDSSMLFKQAKEMEKEQIMEAFKHGELPPLFDNLSAEQYYKETFGETIVTEYRDGSIDVETFKLEEWKLDVHQ